MVWDHTTGDKEREKRWIYCMIVKLPELAAAKGRLPVYPRAISVHVTKSQRCQALPIAWAELSNIPLEVERKYCSGSPGKNTRRAEETQL